MNHRTFLRAILLLSVLVTVDLNAQTPLGKWAGFGFSIGEPTAITARFRTGRLSAVDFAVGKAVMGYPRIHTDLHWLHPTIFSSPVYGFYSGLGLAIGFGKKGEYFILGSKADSSAWFFDADVPVMARGTIGINIFPRYTPIEIFVEANPLMGFIPKLAFDFEAAIGVRFYP